ncbi:caspase family protein [Sphingomonas sp. M6A6_1c]
MNDGAFIDAHALVVGISDYQFANPLSAAVLNDAEDLVALLRDPRRCAYDPDRVHVLLDGAATRTAILAALDEIAAVARARDTVCIYFSGHGWRAKDSENSFLLPVEASRAAMERTGIAASLFSEHLSRIDAGRLVVILDACHAGGAGELKEPFEGSSAELALSSSAIELLASGAGRAIIASSRPDEKSLIMPGARNSAFTTALLEGLSGAADTGRSGSIRLFSLFEYVAERVPSLTGGRQHPLLRTKLETNFALASSPPSSSPDPGELRDLLYAILPTLYPGGPTDRDVWERAGGHVWELTLGRPGRSQWFEALRLLANGGGGDLDMAGLIKVALNDFPKHVQLRALT